ncbi:MAG: RidA family protein [Armatimonadetes bacterium]|nr:RidA family protein [Armatimonadota bacterium]
MALIEDRIRELGWSLGEPPDQRGKLAPAVRTGNLVYTSGNTCRLTGKVGGDVTAEQAYEGAREAILRCLAAVKWRIGDLDRVTRVVKLLGLVNCAAGFYNTPAVINGATDALLEIFGPERGWHARSAIGVYQLPGNAAVEIEMIVEVAD